MDQGPDEAPASAVVVVASSPAPAEATATPAKPAGPAMATVVQATPAQARFSLSGPSLGGLPSVINPGNPTLQARMNNLLKEVRSMPEHTVAFPHRHALVVAFSHVCVCVYPAHARAPCRSASWQRVSRPPRRTTRCSSRS